MPQVAARINDEQERWLKDYFRTKSAGAEFILPWAVDTFFRAMANIKQMFTAGELKTIMEAHKDMRLLPDHTRLSYLLLRVSDACERPKAQIGIQAIRGGDVVGVHTVYFMGPGERIEVTHQAHSRETFAQGALRAAAWLCGQQPGRLYGMQDIF